MDIFEQRQGPTTPTAAPALPAEPDLREGESVDLITGPADEGTIFTMLAARARTRASAHLWLTAGIGGIDALALVVARPSLWWIAAACLSVSAYAVWGLADRALARADRTASRWRVGTLEVVRAVSVAVGVAGGVGTRVGFLGAALGRCALGW